VEEWAQAVLNHATYGQRDGVSDYVIKENENDWTMREEHLDGYYGI
jgi:hypothetical protein